MFNYCSTAGKCSLAVSAQSTQDTNKGQNSIKSIHLWYLCNSVLVATVFFLDNVLELEYSSHSMWEGCWWCILKVSSCFFCWEEIWLVTHWLSFQWADFCCLWFHFVLFLMYYTIPTDIYECYLWINNLNTVEVMEG